MVNKELVELFIRSKVLLQEKLAEVGQIPGSAEIESQMMFIETRLTARLMQDMSHAKEEMNALRFILIETAKPDRDE